MAVKTRPGSNLISITMSDALNLLIIKFVMIYLSNTSVNRMRPFSLLLLYVLYIDFYHPILHHNSVIILLDT